MKTLLWFPAPFIWPKLLTQPHSSRWGPLVCEWAWPGGAGPSAGSPSWWWPSCWCSYYAGCPSSQQTSSTWLTSSPKPTPPCTSSLSSSPTSTPAPTPSSTASSPTSGRASRRCSAFTNPTTTTTTPPPGTKEPGARAHPWTRRVPFWQHNVGKSRTDKHRTERYVLKLKEETEKVLPFDSIGVLLEFWEQVTSEVTSFFALPFAAGVVGDGADQRSRLWTRNFQRSGKWSANGNDGLTGTWEKTCGPFFLQVGRTLMVRV